MKKALISGITGQDGSYLAEFLLGKGYEVYGIIRRSSSFNTGRIDPIYEDPHVPHRRLHLVYGDLNDASSLNRIIRTIQPDEIYNLGAQSHVRVSFDIPEYTGEITGLGTIRLLEAIRESGLKPKFYQASSSEMFGKVQEVPQCETTPFYSRSPYGAAKVYSYWITVNSPQSSTSHFLTPPILSSSFVFLASQAGGARRAKLSCPSRLARKSRPSRLSRHREQI